MTLTEGLRTAEEESLAEDNGPEVNGPVSFYLLTKPYETYFASALSLRDLQRFSA